MGNKANSLAAIQDGHGLFMKLYSGMHKTWRSLFGG